MATIPSWQSLTVLLVLAVLGHFAAHWLWQQRQASCAPPESGCSRRHLGIGAGLCALLFACLTTALLGSDAVTAFDTHVRTLVSALHDNAFVQFCLFITSAGNSAALVAVTLVTLGLLWTQSRQHAMVGLLLSVLGAQATTYIAKYAIGRERPPFEAFAQALTPSFPSAHATGAVAVYGFIVHVIAHPLPPTRVRFEITYWGTLFVLLLAASRVVIGVHYVSDVIAGLLVGLFWLFVGCSVTRND